MISQDFLREALISVPVFMFSLTVHEFFHAWSALKFGDTTARDLGRLTLNPIAHLDIWGTLSFFLSGLRFGWAKPVPVDLRYVRHPRVADFWISAAGPLSNLGLGLIFGIVARLVTAQSIVLSPVMESLLERIVIVNVSLAFFNLIPLFPLDGSHVLRNLLPAEYEEYFHRFDMVAPILLMIIIFTGLTWVIIGPIVVRVITLFTGWTLV
ncbi:MAG: site-2 protease family protein [candidate division Zixibacteria bacterium]|nr:site-2 protease family protein [candidate division Zixibacteria bacterium]